MFRVICKGLKFQFAAVAGGVIAMQDTEKSLILFHNNNSYYSRKVSLTLQEKKIPYISRIMNLFKNEQYEPWFLEINPRGEIPVIKNHEHIVVDSANIIDYLEDNFSYGEYISLTPKDLGQEVSNAVIKARKQIDGIEGNLLLFGLVFHEQYCDLSDAHYPLNLPGSRRLIQKQVINMPLSLRKLAESYPEYGSLLLEKALRAEKTAEIAQSVERFEEELGPLKILLADMEQQLSLHPEGSDCWLVCERFTQADVSLTILMDRVWRAGAAETFWGQYPLLKNYFKRIQARQAYKEIEPSLWQDIPPIALVVAGILVCIIVVLSCIPLMRTKKS